MAIYSLQNAQLGIRVDSHGAELKSLKKLSTNVEYMWDADPAYWAQTSPALFPFVGSLNGGSFRYEGKTYPMTKHGFAMDMEFELLHRTENELRFLLRANRETKEKYPFDFAFEQGYRFDPEAENKLIVSWRVTNCGSREMYFSLGGHPGFRYPLDGGMRRDCGIQEDCTLQRDCGIQEDCTLQKDCGLQEDCALQRDCGLQEDCALQRDCGLQEDCTRQKDCRPGTGYMLRFDTEDKILSSLVGKSSLLTGGIKEFALRGGMLDITPDLFDVDTLILEWGQVHEVALCEGSGEPYVTVRFDAPIVAIWSPAKKNAPFICIEPWYGICDRETFAGELSQREYGNRLAPGGEFYAEYAIEV